MRDLETIETALTAAETGHLVMSTLHTLDATETINRIVSVFPPLPAEAGAPAARRACCKAVISQRLVPRADGKGRVAAVEVLVNTARVRELIEDKDRTKEIPDAIAQGHQTYGMQTFDQSLMSLVRQNIITYEEAHRQATNPDDFALRVQRHQRHQRRALGRLRGCTGWELGAGQRRLRPARHPVGGAAFRSRPGGGAPSCDRGAGDDARAHQPHHAARGRGRGSRAEAGRRSERAAGRGRRLPHRAVLSAAGPSRLAGRPGTSSARWRLRPARTGPAAGVRAAAGR